MQKRRIFLKSIIGLVMSTNLFMNPVFSLVRSVYARTRKIVLPGDTDPESLIGQNPRLLDTTRLEITPLKDFKTMGPTDHAVDLEKWRLDVTGNVEESLHLSYSDLAALPSIERKVLLICPGVFANHGRWKGTAMKPLLEKVKLKTGVTHVTFSGPRGAYEKVERFSLEDVLSGKIFLAYAVNGMPLPRKHGFPLRVVAEGHYGNDWVKYVDQIKLEKR